MQKLILLSVLIISGSFRNYYDIDTISPCPSNNESIWHCSICTVQSGTVQSGPFNVLQHLVISILAKQQLINLVPFNVLQHLVTIILLHHYRRHQN